jgi:D-alanine-D-alanine ligase
MAGQARHVALRVWRGLGCRDAGRIDLRCDAEGRVNFIEVNPLAGLHPIDSDLSLLCALGGIPHRELITMILDSARARISAPSSARGPSLV